MGNGKKKGRYGAIGIVSMLLLTVLGFGLYLADWDDLLFATAKNERVMAIVYTPNLAPGDRAVVKLILRTGTKSVLARVMARHQRELLPIRVPGGQFGSSAVLRDEKNYQGIVEIQLPADAPPGKTLDLELAVLYRPPAKNPVGGLTSLPLALKVLAPSAKRRAQIYSALTALGALAVALFLSFLSAPLLTRHGGEFDDPDDPEMVVWFIGMSVAMLAFVGYWFFAMPLCAATGSHETWLFVLLITFWTGIVLLGGWLSARRLPPGANTMSPLDRIELSAPDQPERACTLNQLERALTASYPGWKLVRLEKALRIESGKNRIWLSYRDDARIRVAELTLSARPPEQTEVLQLACALAQLLGGFVLNQLAPVHIDPARGWEETRLAQAEAFARHTEQLLSVLRAPFPPPRP